MRNLGSNQIRRLLVINIKNKLPGVVSNISPHSKQNSGSDQAVFDNEWIKVRPREFENVSHNGSAPTSEIIS